MDIQTYKNNLTKTEYDIFDLCNTILKLEGTEGQATRYELIECIRKFHKDIKETGSFDD